MKNPVTPFRSVLAAMALATGFMVSASSAQECTVPYSLIETTGGVSLDWSLELDFNQEITTGVQSHLTPEGNWYLAFGTGWSLTSGRLDIRKFSPSLRSVWRRVYQHGNGYHLYPRDVDVDPEENVYILIASEYSVAPPESDGRDIVLAKYDSSGNALWATRFSRTESTEDVPWAMVADPDGNVIVVGHEGSINPPTRTVLTKFGSDGQVLWSSPFAEESFPYDVATDDEGSIYVAGSIDTLRIESSSIVKYSPDGERLWKRFLSPPPEGYSSRTNGYARNVRISPSGEVYVSGVVRRGEYFDFITAKYTPNGDLLWSRTYDFQDGDDWAADMEIGPDGGVYVVGHSFVTGPYRLTLIRYNPDGEELWTSFIGEAAPCSWHYQAASLLVDTSGNAYVSGYTVNNRICVWKEGTQDLLTAKFDRSGNLTWITQWDTRNPGDGIDGALWTSDLSLEVDAAGRVHQAFLYSWCPVYTPCLFCYQTQTPYQLLVYSQPGSNPTSSPTLSDRASSFSLSNFPNPFNSETLIRYEIPQAADLSLAIFDVFGREVRVLATGTQPTGMHELQFDASGLPSGVYFYRLVAGDHAETRKMVLLR